MISTSQPVLMILDGNRPIRSDTRLFAAATPLSDGANRVVAVAVVWHLVQALRSKTCRPIAARLLRSADRHLGRSLLRSGSISCRSSFGNCGSRSPMDGTSLNVRHQRPASSRIEGVVVIQAASSTPPGSASSSTRAMVESDSIASSNFVFGLSTLGQRLPASESRLVGPNRRASVWAACLQVLVVRLQLPADLLQGERRRAFRFEELEDHQLIGRRRDLELTLLDRFDEPFARGGAELRGRQAAPRFRFQHQHGLGDGGRRQIVARDQLLQARHDRRIAVELGDLSSN